jgi:molybdate transport system substrate-binding protein
MHALGVFEALQDKFVRGESVGQAFSFVAVGNADLGFVALSEAKSEEGRKGSSWEVPENL